MSKSFSKEEGSKAYVNFLKKYLGENSDAYIWVAAYTLYVHALDDIIDNEVPISDQNEFFLKTVEFAEVVYSNHFYIQHLHLLRPLIKMASNTYMDSVQFERTNEPWKRYAADSLRNMGNEVILACVEIVGGIELRRKASLELREISHFTHHDDNFNPK